MKIVRQYEHAAAELQRALREVEPPIFVHAEEQAAFNEIFAEPNPAEFIEETTAEEEFVVNVHIDGWGEADIFETRTVTVFHVWDEQYADALGSAYKTYAPIARKNAAPAVAARIERERRDQMALEFFAMDGHWSDMEKDFGAAGEPLKKAVQAAAHRGAYIPDEAEMMYDSLRKELKMPPIGNGRRRWFHVVGDGEGKVNAAAAAARMIKYLDTLPK